MPQRFDHYRGMTVDIKIDDETCTACQLCYESLPYVFVNRGDGIPLVIKKNLKESILPDIEKIAADCPASSIEIYVG